LEVNCPSSRGLPKIGGLLNVNLHLINEAAILLDLV